MKLDLRTTGMEFASEMVIKATLYNMRITEVPTILFRDGRSRRPHLQTWRDGWRHLRFLLLYSPRWLFLYPGIVLMLSGLIVVLWLSPEQRTVGRITFDVHTLHYAALAIVVGFQAVIFAALTRIFAMTEGLLPVSPQLNRLFTIFSLELGLTIGGILVLLGLAGSFYTLSDWGAQSFGPLNPSTIMRMVIPASLALTLGFQTIIASLFMSVLGLPRHRPEMR